MKYLLIPSLLLVSVFLSGCKEDELPESPKPEININVNVTQTPEEDDAKTRALHRQTAERARRPVRD